MRRRITPLAESTTCPGTVRTDRVGARRWLAVGTLG